MLFMKVIWILGGLILGFFWFNRLLIYWGWRLVIRGIVGEVRGVDRDDYEKVKLKDIKIMLDGGGGWWI